MASVNEKTLFPSTVVQIAGGKTPSPVEKSTLSQVQVMETTHQPSTNFSRADSNTFGLHVEAVTLPRNSDASAVDSTVLNPFDTDVEAVITHSSSRGQESTRVMGDCRMHDNDSRVWPGQKHWRKKAREAKIRRSNTCLSRLSSRNRLIAKILIGLLIIGIAIAVGLGVSKPLGAGIWRPHNS